MPSTADPDPLLPPHTDPAFSELSPMDKHRRMEAWRIATAEAVLAKTGQRRLPEWETGVKRWCTNCWEAFERVDSHGDCADCGEDVWWVTPPAPPTGGPVQPAVTNNAEHEIESPSGRQQIGDRLYWREGDRWITSHISGGWAPVDTDVGALLDEIERLRSQVPYPHHGTTSR